VRAKGGNEVATRILIIRKDSKGEKCLVVPRKGQPGKISDKEVFLGRKKNRGVWQPSRQA